MASDISAVERSDVLLTVLTVFPLFPFASATNMSLLTSFLKMSSFTSSVLYPVS